MRGQNNIQGAGDAGGLPNNYPGFQAVDDPRNQARFSKLYGRSIDLERGITKVRALDFAVEGKIKAMMIVGENTVVSDPDRRHCERALRALDHLVVVDIFRTETAEFADVVLPATAWGETDGVYTNTERAHSAGTRRRCPAGRSKAGVVDLVADRSAAGHARVRVWVGRRCVQTSCARFPRPIRG